MSDFFLTTSEIDLGPVSRSLSFTGYTECAPLDWGTVQGVVSRLDSMDLWGPAFDPVSGIHAAIVGRVALEADEWERAGKLPYEGGLACRMIIDSWLSRKDKFTGWLNGAGLVLVYSDRDRQLHLVTDRMGMIPAFSGEAEDLFLCSHTDVLAEAMEKAGIGLSMDRLTMAEFLATSQSVHPHTYYDRIRHMDPAVHYVWDIAENARPVSKEEYWRPAYLESPLTRSEPDIVEQLSEAFRTAIQRRTHSLLGKTGVFLSSGADSRLMTFGVREPDQVECLTFYDQPNEELKQASRLAEIAGARHHPLQRDLEYYGRNAPFTVKVSGGMWSAIHGHCVGFYERVRELEVGTMLTGCFADYMFKGLSINRQETNFLGRKVPVYDLAPFSYQFHQGAHPIAPQWSSKVRERLQERYPGCVVGQYYPDQLQLEDRRLRPLSNEPDYSMRAGLYRTMPFDWVFGDNDVLDVFGRLTIPDKLNGVIFERAVSRIIGKRASRVSNNNYYSAKLGAGTLSRAIHFTLGKKIAKFKNMPASRKRMSKLDTRTSWPNYRHIILHSRSLQDLWADPEMQSRQLISDIMGYDPWDIALDQWARNRIETDLFFKILTLQLWLAPTS